MRTGRVGYYLTAEEVGAEGFDAKLDSLDSAWCEHLSRTADK
jgi:hypothetical protein